jgi:hypothetical protein
MKPAQFLTIGLLFLSSPALAVDPSASGVAAAPASPTPDAAADADLLLMRLRDSDPKVRADAVALAAKTPRHDFRVIDLLSSSMNDAANEPVVQLDAACIVAMQNTPYAIDGARRVLTLIDETGYPNARLEAARAAVARQGDEIISDMDSLVTRGDLNNNFFRDVMKRIGTPAAIVALDRDKSHQSGIDRHTVNR